VIGGEGRKGIGDRIVKSRKLRSVRLTSRDTEGGKSTMMVGKVGRPKQDIKQRKLATEEREGGKRVSFRRVVREYRSG